MRVCSSAPHEQTMVYAPTNDNKQLRLSQCSCTTGSADGQEHKSVCTKMAATRCMQSKQSMREGCSSTPNRLTRVRTVNLSPSSLPSARVRRAFDPFSSLGVTLSSITLHATLMRETPSPHNHCHTLQSLTTSSSLEPALRINIFTLLSSQTS